MGDKKKGKAEKVIVDGIDTSEMKFSKLQEFAQTLLQNLNAARKDRKFLQVQCSQLRRAWEISRTKMLDCENRIRATALDRDKKDQELCGQAIKELEDEGRYIDYILTDRLKEMQVQSSQLLKDVENSWDETTLRPLVDQKTDLKIKLDQSIEDLITSKEEFQQNIDNNTAALIKNLDDETEKMLKDITARLNNYEKKLRLLSDTAFFRNQEDYNKIITELMENGKKNTRMLREFYKRITEDDIVLIIVLESQVRKLKRIVRKKHVKCKKIHEQTVNIESCQGELDINLSRSKRKMKLYETNTLALTRSNIACDQVMDKKISNLKDLKNVSNREHYLKNMLEKQEEYLTNFYNMFLEREKQVFEPLLKKIKILNTLIKRDKKQINSIISTLSPDIQKQAINEVYSIDLLSEECMSRLILDMTRLCATHDNLIKYIEKNLDVMNHKEKYKLNFKRINFDAISYGIGPMGELISKYP